MTLSAYDDLFLSGRQDCLERTVFEDWSFLKFLGFLQKGKLNDTETF